MDAALKQILAFGLFFGRWVLMLGREGDDSGAAAAAAAAAAVVGVAVVVAETAAAETAAAGAVGVAGCTHMDKQKLKIQQTPEVCFLPKARSISLETCRLQK